MKSLNSSATQSAELCAVMCDPKVSIIIPAHNAQEYFRECLETILAQTFTNWEAIIVDDGSTDATGEIAAEYTNKYPQIHLLTTENRGQAAARNRGIEIARGKYYFFIDSDDLIHPRFIEYLLHAAEAHSENSIICGGFIKMQKQQPRRFLLSDPQGGDILSFTPEEAIADMLYQKHIDSSVCGKLIPSGIFSDIRFKENTWYEDLEITPRLMANATEVVVTGFPGYYYRITPGSFMHTLTPSRLHVLDVTREFEKKYAGNAILDPAARDRRFSACCNTLAMLSIGNPAHPSAEFLQAAAQAEKDCWNYIAHHRLEVLRNPRSRLKNRIGALITMLGKRAFLIAAKVVYR